MALLDDLKALEAITELARGCKVLVFFSEGKEYWPHYRGILRELLLVHRCPFIYVASTADDPGLRIAHPLVRTFNIGQGGSRVNLFKSLQADIMVLTMPDLGQLSLARSPGCGEYVYLFHSPVSTHMVYRDGAFDLYDTVFCVGPHHEAEIRRREEMAGLPAKRPFRHGYGRLDEIMADVSAQTREATPSRSRAQVLLAPSWGPAGILETMGGDVVEALLETGCRVVVRPHPQTMRLAREAIDALVARFESRDGFVLETDMASKESFFESDVVVSDWSGAAFDFAFSRLRPVIFLDTPRKVNNPNWETLGIEPIEAQLRDRIGIVVAPGDNAGLADAVASAVAGSDDFRQRILAERERWIFNAGDSRRAAAHELARMAFDASLGSEGDPEDLEARCAEAARAMLGTTDPAAGPGSLPALLSRLLADDRRIAPGDLAHLESLCRRIDVFRKVHRDYDAAFRKPIAQSPLADPSMLPALAHVLIRTARGLDKVERGLALKLLNAAANVLNAYAASGPSHGIVAFESLLARATDKATERAG